MYTLEKALEILSNNTPQIVNNKNYWLNNSSKLQYTDELIIQMANYIKPYKDEVILPTPKNDVYYTETPNGTRQIFLPPEKLQIDVFSRLICNNSFKKYKYAINGTLFGGSICSVVPLMANGNYNSSLCRWGSNHGKPQSCFIINRDNTVEMRKLNSLADLGSKIYSVKHVIGGIGLINKDDGNFIYNPKSEGYTNKRELAGLERKCNKTVLAYIKKTNQIVLMTRPQIHHKLGYSLLRLCKDCEYDYAISLDSSGSTFNIADGKYKLYGDGRGIRSVLYCE